MAIKRPALKKIEPDIKNASIYLRGESKIGKSSTFRDVILEKFGDPTKGLLIKCGAENGDTMLDEVNSVQVETWGEVIELTQWLIEQKGREHQIEIVAFDTVDELIKMAEEEAIRVSNKESREAGKNVRAKSINQAFGGFSKGPAFVVNALLTPLLGKLKSQFGLWCIAHTKMKINTNKIDSLNEEAGVRQLTSNLDSRYEACLSALLDIIVTGAFENEEVIGTTKVGMKSSEREISLVDATKQKRVLYFRSTPLVDAGSRFADYAEIPESMELKPNKNNAKTFIEIVELGMEKSKLKYRQFNNTTKISKGEDLSLNTQQKEEMKASVTEPPVTEQPTVNETSEELLNQVSSLFKSCKDKEVKEKIRSMTGGIPLSKNSSIKLLQEALDLLKG